MVQEEASNTITLPPPRAHHSLGRASSAFSAGSRCPEEESSHRDVRGALGVTRDKQATCPTPGSRLAAENQAGRTPRGGCPVWHQAGVRATGEPWFQSRGQQEGLVSTGHRKQGSAGEAQAGATKCHANQGVGGNPSP